MSKIYAIYRPFYGRDFIKESILSIIDHVDKVFFCYSTMPLANVKSVEYKGGTINFKDNKNSTFDDCLDIVAGMKNPKIVVIKQDGSDNMNQFTKIMNDLILPKYDKPDIAFLIEPDHVFKESEIKKAIKLFEESKAECASTKQIELWKTPDWRIPERTRTGTVFWKVRDKIPPTKRQAEPVDGQMIYICAYTHNFGFCVSPASMFSKHLLSIAFSSKIGDSLPDPEWFDKVWMTWHPIDNNKDMEPSKNHKSAIPKAIPYDVNELPELIREKYGYE